MAERRPAAAASLQRSLEDGGFWRRRRGRRRRKWRRKRHLFFRFSTSLAVDAVNALATDTHAAPSFETAAAAAGLCRRSQQRGPSRGSLHGKLNEPVPPPRLFMGAPSEEGSVGRVSHAHGFLDLLADQRQDDEDDEPPVLFLCCRLVLFVASSSSSSPSSSSLSSSASSETAQRPRQ